MRMRVNPRRDADHDGLPRPRQGGDLVKLIQRVNDDPRHPVGDSGLEILAGLHVAVQENSLRRKADGASDSQFARRADIQREPFGVEQA